MNKWNYIGLAFALAAGVIITWMIMPTIWALNSPKEDLQIYRSGYAVGLQPKQTVNFSHWVGFLQVVKIDVNVQDPDDEVHAVLTDSQGRMVMSEYFKGSLHKVIRVAYFGLYAFVVSNPQDSSVTMQVSLESIPVSQYPQGYDLPMTLPTDIIPLA